MTIDDAKQLKASLDSLIEAFNAKTGAAVTRVELSHGRNPRFTPGAGKVAMNKVHKLTVDDGESEISV